MSSRIRPTELEARHPHSGQSEGLVRRRAPGRGRLSALQVKGRACVVGFALGLGLLGGGLTACVYAPYAPKDPDGLTPPGETEPVRGADPNPLDRPSVVRVVCSPQREPIVETEASRACEADPDCSLVCRPPSEKR